MGIGSPFSSIRAARNGVLVAAAATGLPWAIYEWSPGSARRSSSYKWRTQERGHRTSDRDRRGNEKTMAVAMIMEWEGITPEQYEAARKLVNWEGDVPSGGVFHVAAFSDKGPHITDVWESADDFQKFANERLMPGTKELGLPGEPRVEIYPVHALFAPAFKPV
jgi:hypothetical protein